MLTQETAYMLKSPFLQKINDKCCISKIKWFNQTILIRLDVRRAEERPAFVKSL